MPLKTLFDIDCEALDLFFVNEIEKISITAKSDLPRDVAFKMFRGGGKFKTNSTSKLGFLAKLYILWKAINKRWFVVIEDEDRGMTPGQFMELRKAYKKKDYTVEQARTLVTSGTFVLANKELADCCSYLNRLSTSGAYNYLMKAKNMPANKVDEENNKVAYITKFLVFWEGNKKTIVSKTGLGVPEIYVLLALYSGKETQGATLYHDVFKRAYQSSPNKIKAAFRTLQAKGYILKHGGTSAATMQITASGRDILRSILDKYAINC